MSTLTSIPISDPKRFLALQQRYQQELMGDQRLDEAAKVAARRQLLLENNKVDPNWALPQVKAMSRKLDRLTRRIRQPFGAGTPTEVDEEDDPADDFAAGPVQAMVKRFLKPTASAIKTTPANPPVRRPRVQHTPVVTPSPRRRPPPVTPITGFEQLGLDDESPEDVIDQSYRRLFPNALSPPGTRRASPQYRLESPPSVRRQSPAQLPRTPILYEPFRSSGVSYGPHRVSAPPPDHPFVVGPSRQTPQPIRPLPDPTFDYPLVAQEAYNLQEADKGVQRRKRKRVPSEVRQHVKRLSHTPIARRTRQAVQKKAKEAATSKGTKLLKSWLKFK